MFCEAQNVQKPLAARTLPRCEAHEIPDLLVAMGRGHPFSPLVWALSVSRFSTLIEQYCACHWLSISVDDITVSFGTNVKETKCTDGICLSTEA